MNGKDKTVATAVAADLGSREAVEHFRKGAGEFTKKAARSKASAMKVLVESGIHTESGKLSSKYRS